MKYKAMILKTVRACADVIVEADSKDEAKGVAMEMAEEAVFEKVSTGYGVPHVKAIEE